jgi:hypothetical protein
MMAAAHAFGRERSWDLPDRLLPYLDPRTAIATLAQKLPAMDVTGFSPDRIDPGSNDVSLQGTLRTAEPGGEREHRVAVRASAHRNETVRVSPDDPSLPHLSEVLAHPFVARAIRGATASGGPGPEIRIVAHRFGKHACFRVELPTASFLGRVYARRGDESLVTTLRLLACHWEEIPAAVPRVTFHDRARHFVVLTWLPGTPLHDLLESAPSAYAVATARALRAYQTVPARDLSSYDTQDELGTIRKLARRASRVRPALGPELAAIADSAALAVANHRDEPLVLAHRDLHDKQVIAGDGGVGIIDWDWASASPAGLDPGNFLAHLRLRELQGRIGAERARTLRSVFLAEYIGPDADSRPDLRTWETLALVRLAAVYSTRPAWPGLAESLLELAWGRLR